MARSQVVSTHTRADMAQNESHIPTSVAQWPCLAVGVFTPSGKGKSNRSESLSGVVISRDLPAFQPSGLSTKRGAVFGQIDVHQHADATQTLHPVQCKERA